MSNVSFYLYLRKSIFLDAKTNLLPVAGPPHAGVFIVCHLLCIKTSNLWRLISFYDCVVCDVIFITFAPPVFISDSAHYYALMNAQTMEIV